MPNKQKQHTPEFFFVLEGGKVPDFEEKGNVDGFVGFMERKSNKNYRSLFLG